MDNTRQRVLSLKRIVKRKKKKGSGQCDSVECPSMYQNCQSNVDPTVFYINYFLKFRHMNAKNGITETNCNYFLMQIVESLNNPMLNVQNQDTLISFSSRL